MPTLVKQIVGKMKFEPFKFESRRRVEWRVGFDASSPPRSQGVFLNQIECDAGKGPALRGVTRVYCEKVVLLLHSQFRIPSGTRLNDRIT